jgi:hypothetical protein
MVYFFANVRDVAKCEQQLLGVLFRRGRPQAPADFFLFPRLKSIMKGSRFADVAAIQERVTAVLRSIT